jgi:hypothetical protein
MTIPTYEQIDAAFTGLNLEKHQTAMKQLTAPAVAPTPASVVGQICPVYKAVRPFLQAAASLPFIPQSWRAGISAFVAAMDLLCP